MSIHDEKKQIENDLIESVPINIRIIMAGRAKAYSSFKDIDKAFCLPKFTGQSVSNRSNPTDPYGNIIPEQTAYWIQRLENYCNHMESELERIKKKIKCLEKL